MPGVLVGSPVSRGVLLPPRVSPGTDLLNNLISYWKLDEASGTRVDSVGGNDLTDSNTVTNTTGVVGNAAQFTAVNNECLYHANNPSLAIGASSFTWAAWIHPTEVANPHFIIAKGGFNGGYQEAYVGIGWNQRLSLAVSLTGGGFTETPYVVVSLDTTIYVVAWKDSGAGTINLRVNNGTIQSTPLVGSLFASPDGFYLGTESNGSGFYDGWIDEVGFWKRAWTLAEHDYMWNSGAGRTWSAGGFV